MSLVDHAKMWKIGLTSELERGPVRGPVKRICGEDLWRGSVKGSKEEDLKRGPIKRIR